MLSPKDALLVLRMRRNGIVNPVWTLRAARIAKLPLPLSCAFLEQETARGHNEWGHDPTIFIGGFDETHKKAWGELVTRAAYLEYRALRGPAGHGGMQGVGPCQLTYYSYQDEADKLGGCWKPLCNMVVGFRLAATNIRRNGLRAGIAAYNGSGPAAEHYADNVLALERRWARILRTKSVQA